MSSTEKVDLSENKPGNNKNKPDDSIDKELTPYDIFLENVPEYMKSPDGSCILGIN
jgi:hypothetical protein